MDKFGFFKVLDTFFQYYDKNKNDLNNNKSDILKNLTDLKNIFFQKDENLSKEKQVLLTKKEEKEKKPLQNTMIYAMNNHDNFVKRVMSNNKK